MKSRVTTIITSIAFALTTSLVVQAAAEEYDAHIDKLADNYEAAVIGWRHGIHQNPELSNREFRTAKLIAEHLRSLNIDVVKTDIAPTGVVGILKGGKPGDRVVALRADFDALHVCGFLHRLMGAASVLSPSTVA